MDLKWSIRTPKGYYGCHTISSDSKRNCIICFLQVLQVLLQHSPLRLPIFDLTIRVNFSIIRFNALFI